MNFVWLEDFLALAGSGSFSRAAEQRHSSQPAFSRRIRALEDWLGTPLIDRSAQPVQLTEAGVWFRGVAQDLVQRTQRLPSQAQQVAEANTGRLRMAATHALSFAFWPRWLRSLEGVMASVSASGSALGPVELISDVLARCETLMAEGRVDFVLSHAHATAPTSLDADAALSVQVGVDALVPVSAPARDGAPQYRLDTTGTPSPLLGYSDVSGLGRILRAVLGQRLQALDASSVFTAHLASVLRSMALDGRGVAWLPRSLLDEDLADQRLVLATDDTRWQVPLTIRLYRPPVLANRTVQAFWQAAQARVLS